VPTRQISNTDITVLEGPSASGEGGESILAAAFEDPVADSSDDIQSVVASLDQLSKDVTTLSLVPRSRWQTLLHLDVIRERNKPKEAPKAPEKAPFFLPALVQGKKEDPDARRVGVIPMPLADSEANTSTAAPSQSRLSKFDAAAAGRTSQFTTLLHAGTRAGGYADFIEHFKTLPPAAADIEIRSLQPTAPYDELVAFVNALTARLDSKRDYEVVQAWMAVFLRCHGEVIQEAVAGSGGDGDGRMDVDDDDNNDDIQRGGLALVQAVKTWKQSADRERERLNALVGYCSGVLGFLRSAR